MRSPPDRRTVLRGVGIAAAVGVVAWQGVLLYERNASAGRLVASGSIEATQVDIGPKIPGRVIRLLVGAGDPVRAGQVVAELEPQEASAQVAQVEAAVAQAEAKVAQARQAVVTQQQLADAQVAQAKAQVASASTAVPRSETALAIQERTAREAVSAAEAQLTTAQARVVSSRSALATAQDALRRRKALFAQGAVAADQVEAAQAAYDAAVAQDRSARDAVAQAQAQLASAQANLMQVEIQRKAVEAARANLAQAQAGLRSAESGYTVVAQRQQDLAAAQAALAQAQANLRYVQVISGHNTIQAPRDGVIQTKNVEEGEVVAAGTALYTLIDPRDVWTRVYIREDRIGHVKIGQMAHITVDTVPREIFAGRVTVINTRPEFTNVNVQTKQDRVKLVFGVKIKIDDGAHRLRPGMPARVVIVIGTGGGAAQTGAVLAHVVSTAPSRAEAEL